MRSRVSATALLVVVSVFLVATLSLAAEPPPPGPSLTVSMNLGSVSTGTRLLMLAHEGGELEARSPDRPFMVRFERFEKAPGQPAAAGDPNGVWTPISDVRVIAPPARDTSIEIVAPSKPGLYLYRAFGGFADEQKSSAAATLEVTQ